jgi:hypothetical protein
MRFFYFDETKFNQRESPYFFIGGVGFADASLEAHETSLTKIQHNFFGTSILTHDTEMHGKEIFHGKAHYRGKSISDRLALIRDIAQHVVEMECPIRIVKIDVPAHKAKYKFPQPEYQLGLMLILERICDYLDQVNDFGLVFGDYEKDEITRAVLDFSQFKIDGKTSMYSGRPLGRLLDTIYFTHSHHSRFLQAADVMLYIASRCEAYPITASAKYQETALRQIWENVKSSGLLQIQSWP